ncbi:MAG: amidohydrolase family protein, partial [Lentisphaeria bacterium]|nr:amidohydrolase family protein [Lentisphaeria bacterium]
MDVLLTNGQVYDGSGDPPRRMDILLRDEVIGQLEPAGSTVFPCVTRTDLHGLAVSPGWIDVHAHSDASLFAAPEAFGKISQGVTTEISGNCGLSAFPVLTDEVREHLRTLYAAYDLSPDWTDFAAYAEALAVRGPAVNAAFLCGHNTLRANVSGYENRQLPAGALAQMQRILDSAMRQGALGLSTGLLYTPGCFSEEAELLALLRTAGERGGIYATHLRSEGDKLEEALAEAVRLAENAALPLQISHLKTALPRNWHKLDAVLSTIETARARGVRIGADRYPYTYSQTSLSIVLAAPYDTMTDAAIRSALQNDPAAYERARLELENSGRDWSRVILTQSRAKCAAGLAGKTVLEAAGLCSMTPAELVMEILREDAPGSMAAFGGMSEENLRRILERDWVGCGTDETARPP